jgi:hypothetical protein
LVTRIPITATTHAITATTTTRHLEAATWGGLILFSPIRRAFVACQKRGGSVKESRAATSSVEPAQRAGAEETENSGTIERLW